MRPDAIIALITLLCFSNFTHAQIKASFGNPDPITENRYLGVKGSAFQFDNWLPGKIYAVEGEAINHNKINFNARNGKIEVMDDKGVITIINEVLYNKIELYDGEQVYTFSNRLKVGDINYYQIIYSGKKISFLEKMEAKIKDEGSSEYNAYKSNGIFDKETNSFILKDGQIEEIYRTKKKILEFLDSKELDKFAKDEKLNFKKNEDLIKAFQFYEEHN